MRPPNGLIISTPALDWHHWERVSLPLESAPPASCAGCGACCNAQGTPPFTREGDDRPPLELDWDMGEHAGRYDAGLPCLWYDATTRQCRHYENRPEICKEFAMGGEDCLRMRREQGIG